MQSGISASEELNSTFQTLLTSPSHRGLLLTIRDERIEPLDFLPSSNSFHSDLSHLTPYLKPNEALYILLRRPDDLSTVTSSSSSRLGQLVAITYVPDSAPVKSKTLFASTRLSMVRELGSEHFSDQVFVTDAGELSKEGWEKYEKHQEGGQPLTREEQDLKGIKDAEASEAGGTGQRRGMVEGAGSMDLNVGEGVVDALEALGKGVEENIVGLKWDSSTETLHLTSAPTTASSPSEVSSKISPNDPQYTFYRHIAPDQNSAIVFIYTCPSSSKIKERMLYASSRHSVINIAQKNAGLEVSKKLEATDPSEITGDTIEEEFKEAEPEKAGRGGFAKPKRPGRK